MGKILLRLEKKLSRVFRFREFSRNVLRKEISFLCYNDYFSGVFS